MYLRQVCKEVMLKHGKLFVVLQGPGRWPAAQWCPRETVFVSDREKIQSARVISRAGSCPACLSFRQGLLLDCAGLLISQDNDQPKGRWTLKHRQGSHEDIGPRVGE